MKLSIEKLCKRYGEQWALKDLSLEVDDASCLALIGPSGGGKSTTLRLLAGLEAPSSGSLKLNGRLTPREPAQQRDYRKRLGIVFQAYNLFPHLDALKNISLPLEKAHGLSLEEARSRAESLLHRLGLAEHASKRPSQLSGGQQQRVAIARALAPDPDTLLLDEPTSALDPEMAAEVLEVVEELIAEGKNIVIVTHQMGFARRAADQVALIAEGSVIETGASEELFSSPQTQVAQRFLSKVMRY